ncbi:MAG TPA: TonB family protein [Candidatus Krumholzibacteria bacterium]|nr:TonB family protein [Candidatus Krumholzibacteria bacterium]
MRPAPRTSPETEQARFRRGAGRRLLGALAAALLLLLLGIWLGPDREDVIRTFEFSGKEGPLEIMPELSVDDGRDTAHQEALRREEQPPQPAPYYEIEPDDPEAVETQPETAPPVPTPAPEEELLEDADLDEVDAVEMSLPSQTNPWFKLITMVRPRYPLDASPADRALPKLEVEVAFYVAPTGEVQGAYILSNEGGPAFADVVLRAVQQWRYEPLPGNKAPEGFWNRLTLTFVSPRPVRSVSP